MTPKEALEYLENRLSKLAINHKIGNRNIANLEIKDIVAGIETHVIPTIEALVVEHEALKKDVARYFDLSKRYLEIMFDDDETANEIKVKLDDLYEKLSKVGKEE